MDGRRIRKQQYITLSIIAVAVVTLSIGFAAFSSTLRISTQAAVNPDSSTFSVIFSSDGIDTATTQTVSPDSETYGDSATIINGTSPTISGINAKFTSPGQSVTYAFYAKNTGSYLAYLNYITYIGEKTCKAQTGTTQSLVDQACEGISISVKVGADEAVIDTSSISNHTLAANANEQVIVTVSYAEDAAIADGTFEIAFGDISLTYSTISNYVQEEIPEIEDKPCTIERQNEGMYTVGDVVTCELEESTDKFYIIEDAGVDATHIQVLTEKNIHITEYRQSDNPGTTKFCTYTNENQGYCWTYTMTNGEIQNSNTYENHKDNLIYPIVEGYVSYLNETLNNSTGELLHNSQVYKFGYDTADPYTTCSNLPSFFAPYNFWMGHTMSHDSVWFMCGVSISYDQMLYVRPVITISTDDIE